MALFKRKAKAKKKKKSAAREWFDAIIFAVIAATIIRMFLIEAYVIPTPSMERSMLVGDFLFVSKLNYGPRLPNTPLSFPFVHNTLPLFGGKSYIESWQLPYKRIGGFEEIENGDVVVFNYPSDDDRPADKKDNYIKRCVGISGDTLSVVNGVVHINGIEKDYPEKLQHTHMLQTKGGGFSRKALEEMEIYPQDQIMNPQGAYFMTIDDELVSKFNTLPNVVGIERHRFNTTVADPQIYPHQSAFKWNRDWFGPLVLPKRGMKMAIDTKTALLYQRAIEAYEPNEQGEKGKNKLSFDNDKVLLNGVELTEYTWQLDYYFMMGDNRHNSSDSRFWGMVPEDHVVGKAVFIWMSWDSTKKFFSKIRWNRLFTLVHKD